ncbi:MAG: YfjI family protein [Anaerolineae bacterium]|nr:YfjI family protein [Anaerolineae bacterium]
MDTTTAHVIALAFMVSGGAVVAIVAVAVAAGGVFALGLAAARRCFLHLHEPIYPHLYVLWVAHSSIYKKTTGLAAIADLVRRVMPHMLLPEEMSPESFVNSLAGGKPENFDSLPPFQQQVIAEGRRFAGQRGILLDEASSLFGASRKDYMQGQDEMIMRLYDAPAEYSRELRSVGRVTVRHAALSILGATTPVAMARTVKEDAWADGMMARLAMLCPDGLMPYDLGDGDPGNCPDANLVALCQRYHLHVQAL